ncbi:hypothetical protein HanHA300_Chr07g0234541 [Helianthus annuus]|nr:hypothetical protein HanHA300_Chr07g0234541 [Helianthus annuus]KAJ0562466.1 hypothetical protein HanHA89_Chr07g0251731 [Helianthus annuus]KAJ0727842.1 hypothetical protein HanLR1_Chr07g0234501 [Helianthus annuus]
MILKYLLCSCLTKSYIHFHNPKNYMYFALSLNAIILSVGSTQSNKELPMLQQSCRRNPIYKEIFYSIWSYKMCVPTHSYRPIRHKNTSNSSRGRISQLSCSGRKNSNRRICNLRLYNPIHSHHVTNQM